MHYNQKVFLYLQEEKCSVVSVSLLQYVQLLIIKRNSAEGYSIYYILGS